MAGRFFPHSERPLSLSDRRSVPVVIEISQYRGSAAMAGRERLSSRSEMDLASRYSAMGLGCVRGTTLALLFEAATVLVIYGIWQVCQLFR